MTMAIICIAGIGLAAAVTLAVADRCLSVKEDPRIGLVTAALPGANCSRVMLISPRKEPSS